MNGIARFSEKYVYYDKKPLKNFPNRMHHFAYHQQYMIVQTIIYSSNILCPFCYSPFGNTVLYIVSLFSLFFTLDYIYYSIYKFMTHFSVISIVSILSSASEFFLIHTYYFSVLECFLFLFIIYMDLFNYF